MEAINIIDDGTLCSGEDVSISSSFASAMLSDQDSTADIIHGKLFHLIFFLMNLLLFNPSHSFQTQCTHLCLMLYRM